MSDEHEAEKTADAKEEPVAVQTVSLRVLRSQGKTRSFWAMLDDSQHAEVAALEGDQDIQAKFAAWLNNFHDQNKASVEGEAKSSD